MKRTFLTKRNALLTPGSFSVGALVLGVVLLFTGVRVVAPSFFFTLTAPLFRASSWVSTLGETVFASVADKITLEQINNDLRTQNAILRAENQALQATNEALSPLKRVTSRKGEEGYQASVLSRPPESPYDTLLIDQGAREGIQTAMTAWVSASVGVGIPVGTVTDVGEHVARVTLFTAPGVTTPAWVGKEKTPVTLVGAGGGALTSAVARGSEVSEGDSVMVGGGVVVGYVVARHENPSSPVIALSIQLVVNPFSISWVLVRPGEVDRQEAAPKAP